MQRLGCEKRTLSQTAHQIFEGGFFFFFCLFLFFPLTGSFFLLSAGRLLVVVSLHSTTLQSTLSWGSVQQLSRLLLSLSLTGLYCAKSWKLINSVCLTSQPFVSGVSLCSANIFRAPYQDRSSMYTKYLKAMTVVHWVRALLFQFWYPLITPVFIQDGADMGVSVLLKSPVM